MPDPSATVDDPMLTVEPLEGSYTTAEPKIANQPKTVILSDEEVDSEIDRYPYYDQAQRAEADAKLANYFEDRNSKLADQRLEERQRQLLDYNNEEKAKFYATPEVQEAVWLNQDPNKMWAKHVITGVLEDKLKRPLVDGEYEGAKNKIIGMPAGIPKIDDAGALSVLTKQAETAEVMMESLQFTNATVAKGIIESFAPGAKPFLAGDAWDAARKKFPDAMKGQEGQWYDETERIYLDKKERLDRNGPALYTGLSYIRKWQANAATPDDERAFVDAMISIPPEDLEESIITLTDAVKSEVVDPNAVKNIMDTLVTEHMKLFGFKNLSKDVLSAGNDAKLQGMQNQVTEGKARVDAKGTVVWYPEGTEALFEMTPEQKAQALADVERGFGMNRVWRAFRRITEPGLAPHIFKEGTGAFIERSYFGALENLAPMAVLAAGNLSKRTGVGYSLYMATVVPSSYEQTMFKNPLMDRKVAVGMAVVEGNVNFIGDNLQLKALKGMGATKYLQGLLGRVPLGRAAGRMAGIWGSETAIEMGQDFFSDLGKSALQEILLKANPDLKVGEIKSFNDAMKDTWESAPEVAGQMFFLSAFGVGALTFRDVRDPKKVIYNRQSLLAAGFDEGTITSLLWETDFDERDVQFEKAFDALTPEQINNGILYRQKQAEAIKAKVSSTGVEATGEPAPATERPRPSLVEVTAADGTRLFNVLDENGNVVREGVSEEIAAAEYAAQDERIEHGGAPAPDRTAAE